MLNFQTPFGRGGSVLGGIGGGAAGSGLGAAGQFLQPLDYPRQALWNLFRGFGDMLGGEAEVEDILRTLPGLAGAGLTGGLALSGMGLPAAALAGSALGGIGQGLGLAADEETFQAPAVSDLTGTEDFLTNLGVGMLIDPLTYAGAPGGAKVGSSLGRGVGERLGSSLDDASRYLGPQYSSTLKDLQRQMGPAFTLDKNFRPESIGVLQRLLRNQEALKELNPQASFLGSGVESAAFLNPEGHVTLMRTHNPQIAEHMGIDASLPPSARVAVEEMLPSARSAGYTGENPVMVEHVPFANIPGSLKGNVNTPELMQIMQRAGDETKALYHSLQDKGIEFWDHHLGNVGYDAQGKLRVTDPGAIDMPPAGTPMTPDVRAGAPPAWWQILLAKALGGPKMVRRNLAEELAPLNAQPWQLPASASTPSQGTTSIPPMMMLPDVVTPPSFSGGSLNLSGSMDEAAMLGLDDIDWDILTNMPLGISTPRKISSGLF